jgi:hypothetical protein
VIDTRLPQPEMRDVHVPRLYFDRAPISLYAAQNKSKRWLSPEPDLFAFAGRGEVTPLSPAVPLIALVLRCRRGEWIIALPGCYFRASSGESISEEKGDALARRQELP